MALGGMAFIAAVGLGWAAEGVPVSGLPPGEPPPLGSDAGTELDQILNTRVTVSSTRPESLLSTPSTVTVISRATLQRYNLQTIGEALDLVSGVEVMRTHFKRNLVTMRGVLQDYYASKVLILIDGVPAWHASTGEGNTYRIDAEDVERLEVLRGPASVLYGSNAYVGAVNIVLRKPMGNEGGMHGMVASRGGVSRWDVPEPGGGAGAALPCDGECQRSGSPLAPLHG